MAFMTSSTSTQGVAYARIGAATIVTRYRAGDLDQPTHDLEDTRDGPSGSLTEGGNVPAVVVRQNTDPTVLGCGDEQGLAPVIEVGGSAASRVHELRALDIRHRRCPSR